MRSNLKDIKTQEYIEKNLSIIIQGPVLYDNITHVANFCQHWRNILPDAEIILSVSETDCLDLVSVTQDEIIKKIELPRKVSHIRRHEMSLLSTVCDFILYNQNSIAIQFDNYLNINYLIESVKNGLKVATKKYCLRVRNDIFFFDKNFIRLYIQGSNLPRNKRTSFFKERILIPWFLTRNPFDKARMPLHFNDWMHFGLTEDIRTLWEDVPPYTVENAIYYRFHNKPRISIDTIEEFSIEKHIVAKLAVEQYVIFSMVKKFFPDFHLDYFNDCSNINLSLDILIDNFYVFGRKEFHFYFNKEQYYRDFYNIAYRSFFITEDAWRFMVLNRTVPYNKVLSGGNVDKNIYELSKGTFFLTHESGVKFDLNFIDFIVSAERERGNFRKIINFLFEIILSGVMKNKFINKPESFFKDSKIKIVRFIGKYYLK